MGIIETVAALQAPILHRVKQGVLRGVVDQVDDDHLAQELRVRTFRGEVASRVENLAGVPGVTSITRPGAEVVLVHVGGMRDHAIAIAVADRETRPKGEGEPGDLILYHTANPATRIHVKADGSIRIVAGAGIDIEGDLRVTGSLDVGSDVTAVGSVTAGADVADQRATMAADRTIFDAHVHKENGSGGGVTDPTFTPQS